MKFLMLCVLLLQTSPSLQDNLGELLYDFANVNHLMLTLRSCWGTGEYNFLKYFVLINIVIMSL